MATKAATKKQSSPRPAARSGSTVTLGDAYGLGLITLHYGKVDHAEIIAHLSPAAKKIARTAIQQLNKKKQTSKRRVAVKR